MISVLGSKEKICIEFKYIIRFKLLIINILYYYYTYYSLPNYLFKLKSIINNSISPPQKPFAITKAYFAIRFPYLRITLPHLSKDDLCQEKSHTLLEKVNKPFGNMEKTSYLCPRTLRRWQLGFTCCKFGCLSGGGGATSWKSNRSVMLVLWLKPEKFQNMAREHDGFHAIAWT